MIELTDKEWASIDSVKDVHYLIKEKIDRVVKIRQKIYKDDYWETNQNAEYFVLLKLYTSLCSITRQDKIDIYKEALIRKMSGLIKY